MKKMSFCAAGAAVLSAMAASAIEIDRSVMSDGYWMVWNDAGVAGEPLVSGLLTIDMKKKPAYEMLDQLINHE